MDFSLTEEQCQIKQMVKQFCKRELDFKQIKDLDEKTTQSRIVEKQRTAFPTLCSGFIAGENAYKYIINA